MQATSVVTVIEPGRSARRTPRSVKSVLGAPRPLLPESLCGITCGLSVGPRPHAVDVRTPGPRRGAPGSWDRRTCHSQLPSRHSCFELFFFSFSFKSRTRSEVDQVCLFFSVRLAKRLRGFPPSRGASVSRPPPPVLALPGHQASRRFHAAGLGSPWLHGASRLRSRPGVEPPAVPSQRLCLALGSGVACPASPSP